MQGSISAEHQFLCPAVISASCTACAMISEVESFTVDSMIKGYQIYKNVWSSTAEMKEMEKCLSCRHPATAKLTEKYTHQSTCKET